MAKVKEIEPYRKKKKRKSLAIRIVLLILITIAVVIFVAFSEQLIDQNFFNDLFFLEHSTGYPVEATGGAAEDIFALKKSTVLLTDAELLFYDEDGNLSSHGVHSCNNPFVKIRDDKVLIYDKGNNSFQIQNAKGVVYRKRMDNQIITADIANNGSYAIATSSLRYLSEMVIYNSRNEEIGYWRSSGSYISSISFSDNSKNIAASSIYAEDGAMKSFVRVFDISRTESPVIWEQEYQDSAILSVQYLSSECLAVVFDDRAQILESDGTVREEYRYPCNLVSCEITPAGVVLMLQDENANHMIRVLSDSGFSSDELQVTEVKDVCFSGEKLYLLSDDTLKTYDAQLNLLDEIPDLPDTFKISVYNDRIYTLTFTHIDRYPKVSEQD